MKETSNVLVINCGSSSLKFAVIHSASGQRLMTGLAERLGDPEAVLHWQSPTHGRGTHPIPHGDHQTAMQTLSDILRTQDLLATIQAVGHRVVHGGEQFTHSTRITDEVLAVIRACVPLAPLHNPANIIGIETAQAL
ncbi:MAG: acetate kinase, partial [Anaerolineales bacterium]|nr:acetate kinase [Anaerolineales bacterium]